MLSRSWKTYMRSGLLSLILVILKICGHDYIVVIQKQMLSWQDSLSDFWISPMKLEFCDEGGMCALSCVHGPVTITLGACIMITIRE